MHPLCASVGVVRVTHRPLRGTISTSRATIWAIHRAVRPSRQLRNTLRIRHTCHCFRYCGFRSGFGPLTHKACCPSSASQRSPESDPGLSVRPCPSYPRPSVLRMRPSSPLFTSQHPLSTRHSPLSTHHSPLSTRHSPLSTFHSSLTTFHSPLATSHSPTQRLPTHSLKDSPLTTRTGPGIRPPCVCPSA